jgi:hypothetical protein
VTDLPSRVGFTITFLRMATTQMRELTEDYPEIAKELLHVAEQLHASRGRRGAP